MPLGRLSCFRLMTRLHPLLAVRASLRSFHRTSLELLCSWERGDNVGRHDQSRGTACIVRILKRDEFKCGICRRSIIFKYLVPFRISYFVHVVMLRRFRTQILTTQKSKYKASGEPLRRVHLAINVQARGIGMTFHRPGQVSTHSCSVSAVIIRCALPQQYHKDQESTGHCRLPSPHPYPTAL